MYTVFAEYQVIESYQHDYLLQMKHIGDRFRKNEAIRSYQFMEAVDQSSLYVDVLQLDDLSIYLEWKRLINTEPDRLPWSAIFPYIRGGAKKFHLWLSGKFPSPNLSQQDRLPKEVDMGRWILMEELKQLNVQQFQEDLLNWFEKNMRDLPWRRDRDPYKIWVSEIMLQQTRVDTVIPYFERFMQRFPTLESLAQAEESEVLKMWEGLGYYSRARNLHAAVKEVQETYGGKVPDDPQQIVTLKGVGSYTAGAILSIAYGKPEPAVDGNVMRVFARLFAIEDDIAKMSTKKKFEALIRSLIPDNASYFNQGVMELGALICTPKAPNCLHCPVQDHCRARMLGMEEELPVKQKKQRPPVKKMVAGVLEKDGYVLVRQRPDRGLLAKLFEFPNTEVTGKVNPAQALCAYLFDYYQFPCVTVQQYPDIQHTFSHLIWDIVVYRLSFAEDGPLQKDLPADSRWIAVHELDSITFPVSHQKIKQYIHSEQPG